MREKEILVKEGRRGRVGVGNPCIEMYINELASQLKFTLRYGTVPQQLILLPLVVLFPLLLLLILLLLLPAVVAAAATCGTVVPSQVCIEKLMRFSA